MSTHMPIEQERFDYDNISCSPLLICRGMGSAHDKYSNGEHVEWGAHDKYSNGEHVEWGAHMTNTVMRSTWNGERI